MAVNPARHGISNPAEPVLHDLPPFKFKSELVAVRLCLRRVEDGTWRAALFFGTAEPAEAPATAEIFCAASEAELWQAVHDLREHHLCDLYRSLIEE